MEPILPQGLPTEVLTFRGTASELAAKCNELLRDLGLGEEEDGPANERLIRHYVQVGVLTAPDREGREALFGAQQVAEFLTARHLLKDGWTLSKIAELIKSAGPEGLMRWVPGDPAPTAAQQVLTRLRSATPSQHREPPRPNLQTSPSRSRLEEAPPQVDAFNPNLLATSEPLYQAREISRRRLDLQQNLKALGNASGRPERRRTVRISLAPWCNVYLDAQELQQMLPDTPEILGNALIQALHEERLRKGEKS